MFVLLLIQLLITLLTVISFSPLHTHTQICRLTGASRVSRLSKAHRLSMITKNTSTKQLEKQLESLFSSNEMTGRGAKASTKVLDEVNEIITQLENNSNRIKNPIDSKLIDGCWRLIYTSSPGTNSPIQRSFTAFDGVTIYQIVNLVDTTKSYLSNNQPDVSNVVCFGKNGRLRVTALASTFAAINVVSELLIDFVASCTAALKEYVELLQTVNSPLIVPRKGDGKILGLNIFGVSKSTPPRDIKERIDFAFQEALFEFQSIPIIIPYPVPFKLLGDEAKGWIDNTYLSEKYRIARGNKGTTFLLEKIDVSTDEIAQLAIAKKLPVIFNAESKKVESQKSSEVKAVKFDKKASPVTTDNIWLSMFKPKTQAITSKKGRVAIIFPAQLGTQQDYFDLIDGIYTISNGKVKSYAPSLSRFDWPIGLLPSFFSKDYLQGTLKPSKALKFYLEKIDLAVEQAIAENGDVELVLIGHSIGGWIARAWLSEWSNKTVRSKVRSLITLGSPHQPPPDGSILQSADQTRGLLTYINENFPGAFERGVEYYSIIGSQVSGSIPFSTKDYQESKLFSVRTIEGLLAYVSYLFLAGSGELSGDGVIPIETAALDGAKEIILEGVHHSNSLPASPGKSIPLPYKWYGSQDIVEGWIEYVLK